MEIMEIYGNLFIAFWFSDPRVDLPEPAAQKRAKDPRGTPEHGTSFLLRGRIWNFNLSSGVLEAGIDINPTCGAEAELGIRIPTETVLNRTYWKNRSAQWGTLHS